MDADRSRYSIEKSLAQGGMGEVLQAQDLHFGRAVAMKVIRGDSDPSRELKLRFVQEARILSQLEHPNIVPVYDLDKDEQGRVFYTMKKVEGVTLEEVINRLKTGDAEAVEPYPLTQLLTIFQKVCDAVAFAHSKGIVHRDLKPENIMLGGFGEVLVMDWGLAKILGDGRDALPRVQEAEGRGAPRPYHENETAHRPVSTNDAEVETPRRGVSSDEGFQELEHMPGETQWGAGSACLTLDGQVMGTPQFMAPEQAAGEIAKMDERSDVFSLGGILYSLLSLRPPTGGSTVREVLENVKSGYIAPAVIYNKHRKRSADGGELEAPIELAHCPGQRIPDALSAVCQKAMGMEQEERYQTVQELQEDISAYQGGFATGAEDAGRLRRFNLWVRRNKALSISVVVVVMFMATVMGRIISSERAARQALTDLHGLLPTLEKEVNGLVRAHQFEDALNRVNYMLALSPDNADYLNQKGHLLQSLLRFEESAEAYQEALEGKRDLPHAQENLKLSEKLAVEAPGGKTQVPQHFLELETAMNQQNRLAESVAMLKHVGKDRAALLEDYKAALRKAGWEKQAESLQMNDRGRLSMKANGLSISDLTPIRGMPFSSIDLRNNRVSDLSPLAGMPLTNIELSGNPVFDLSSLQGLSLTNLAIDKTKVVNLSPLARMPLLRLDISLTGISDITPLKGMPLEILVANATRVTDLAPLNGMPLKQLDVRGANIIETLEPLRGMKLTYLRLGKVKANDWSPMRGMPLELFECSGFAGSLDVLTNAHLTYIRLTDPVNLTDITPLRGLALKTVLILNTPLRDLKPLSGMPLKTANFTGCKIEDLSPLKGTPIKGLDLSNNKELTSLIGTCYQ